jgi:NHLM bacteriocin system ABC transporter peptidase/ATP-binding protein
MAASTDAPPAKPGQYGPKSPKAKRQRTPTVLQMEAVECGAASLCMILGYFGRIVPLEECRVECGVSRDGSKANNVLKAARKFGLEAKGFKFELESLYELDYPAILFWNANHFVVLEGFKNGKAFLNDPAQGPRQVTIDELDGSFSGVVLTFKKSAEFKPGGEKPSLAGALRRRLRGSEVALGYVMLCGLFLVVPGLVIPTYSRIFVDEVLVANRASVIQPLMVGMAITLLIQGALTWLQRHYLLRLETKLALSTSANFFQHILRLPVGYFAQRFAGEVGSRVGINDKVAGVVSGKLATTAIDCFMVVFYAALMFRYDVGLTLIVIGVALANVVAIKVVARVRTDASRKLMTDKGRLQGTSMGGLRMMETLKATGGENEFFSRWAGYQAKALRAEQQLRQISDMVSVVPTVVGTLVTASVLLFGGLKVMDGVLTVGLLVAYQALTSGFVKPLNSFVTFGSTLQELEADLNRLDDVLRYPQDPLYSRDTKASERDDDRRLKLQGRIELKGITFGYSPLEKPLIEDFELTIEPGKRVALVGGSGSGKSTVAKLVSGLYRPWKGEILFDGVPRDRVPRRLLANSIGLVDQEIFLFDGVLRENITMWDSTVPAGRLTEACRDAAIAEVIETREGGYARVGEDGAKLSGGQRQRLAIARAFLKNAPILILDEATSALGRRPKR